MKPSPFSVIPLPVMLAFLAIAVFVVIIGQQLELPARLLPLSPDLCTDNARECAIAEDVLNSLPPDCRNYIRSLRFGDNPHSSAPAIATVSGDVWIASNLPDEAFRSVLIHECGHIVDLSALAGTPRTPVSAFHDGTAVTYENDPSVGFYRISWLDAQTKKPWSYPGNFVSAYAQESASEDFAETFAIYVIARQSFIRAAGRNAVLRRKLQWMNALFTEGIAGVSGQTDSSAPTPRDQRNIQRRNAERPRR